MPYLDRGDASIWWEEAGVGPPLLLVQGLGYPGDMWHRLVPSLAEHHRVLWFDNRGTGRTGVPAGPYTVELMASDAIAVLDAAGVDAAHVMGASMGGFIVQELALGHPDRVLSLILGCTGTGGDGMVAAEPEAMEMIAARATMTPEDAAEVSIPFVYASSTPRERIDEDFAVRMVRPTTPEGYSNQVAGVVQWRGAFDRLVDLAVPVLVLSGTADRLVNPENSKVLAARIPTSRLVWIDGASHVFFTDDPKATVDAVVGFLAGLG
jgi:pimeloyl-ACP methyl ester carboxylesterase